MMMMITNFVNNMGEYRGGEKCEKSSKKSQRIMRIVRKNGRKKPEGVVVLAESYCSCQGQGHSLLVLILQLLCLIRVLTWIF